MTGRPILFSGPMVRAILAGTKTQTRRVLVPQPDSWGGGVGVTLADGTPAPPMPLRMRESDGADVVITCPYGAPGDRLWVRETWGLFDREMFGGERGYAVAWRATDDGGVTWIDGPDGEGPPHAADRWRPSIHMPRWASRITLPVLSVRVERLQAISEEDARAEGAAWRISSGGDLAGAFDHCDTPIRYRAHFRDLWDAINGKRPGCSWDANPWVWVVGFGPAEVRS